VSGDETTVVIPTNPAPNTTFTGQLQSVGDTFRYVSNEQIVNPDGSITVGAWPLPDRAPCRASEDRRLSAAFKPRCGAVRPARPACPTMRAL